jgi:hypothetical protein
MTGDVGAHEARSIDQRIERILRDLGDPQPPLKLELVFELLKLDLAYYRADDINVFREIAHRVTVAGKQLAARPELAWDAFKAARLSALWIPDEKRICIDETVPKPKHRWMQGHEITHAVTEWHQEFLLGDNESTLDPACYAMLEAEANYGSGRLLFLRDRFQVEAADYPLNFESVKLLKDRFGNTLTSTFWRMVEDRDPTAAVFGLVSKHPRYLEIGEGRDGQPWRDFPRSKAFRERFSKFQGGAAFAMVGRHIGYRRSGPVVEGTDVLIDDNGLAHHVTLQGFCNTYQLLTIGTIASLVATTQGKWI